MTQNEKTLLDAGERQLVRGYRLRFEEVMAEQTTEAVERITGRKVLGYQSQIIFEPTVGIEMFILDGEPSESDHESRGVLTCAEPRCRSSRSPPPVPFAR